MQMSDRTNTRKKKHRCAVVTVDSVHHYTLIIREVYRKLKILLKKEIMLH